MKSKPKITLTNILSAFENSNLALNIRSTIELSNNINSHKLVIKLRPTQKVNIYEIDIKNNNIFVTISNVIGFSDRLNFIFDLESSDIFIKELETLINKVNLLEDTYLDLTNTRKI